MFKNLKQDWNKKIRRLRHQYLILKIKWVLLFVLPILIIIFAYQVVKQYLKLRIREISANLGKNCGTEKLKTEVKKKNPEKETV